MRGRLSQIESFSLPMYRDSHILSRSANPWYLLQKSRKQAIISTVYKPIAFHQKKKKKKNRKIHDINQLVGKIKGQLTIAALLYTFYNVYDWCPNSQRIDCNAYFLVSRCELQNSYFRGYHLKFSRYSVQSQSSEVLKFIASFITNKLNQMNDKN